MSPPPPQPFYLPSQRKRQKQLPQHPNDSASTATLTSFTSDATKSHFTEDTDPYYVPVRASQTHRQGSEPTPRPLTRSNSSPPKIFGPTIPVWQFGKRWRPLLGTSTYRVDNDYWTRDTTSDKRVDTTFRLRALRAKMAEEHIDYLIVPSEDGHLSEYTAPSERRREWISGFSGASGTAIISKRSAYLFIDSLYWVQAQRELDANWSLQKVGWQGTKDWLEWIILCPRGSRVGIDSRMIGHERGLRLFKGLSDRGSKLVHPRQNLVDSVWEDRPKRSKDAVCVQPEEYASKGAQEKLSDLRKWIRSQNVVVQQADSIREWIRSQNVAVEQAERSGSSNSTTTAVSTTAVTAMFVSSLPGVAHMLNLRGSDDPMFTAYLLVTLDKAVLFVDLDKVFVEVKKYLDECGVSLRAYADVWAYLRKTEWGDGKVIISPNTPYAISLITGPKSYHLSREESGVLPSIPSIPSINCTLGRRSRCISTSPLS